MLTRNSFLFIAVATAVTAVIPTGSLVAQRQRAVDPPATTSGGLTVTPYVGIYTPIGTLRADSTVEFQQLMTIAVGVRVAVPVHRSFALEAGASWTPMPSWVAQSDWQQTVDVPGRVALVSMRARHDINLGARENDWSLSVANGFGVVHRHGAAWEGISGTTDAAFVTGATLRQVLESGLSYGVEVEGFLSRSAFNDYQGQRTSARLHADLICSFVLTFRL